MASLSHLHKGFRLGSWQVEPLAGSVTGPGGDARHLEPKVMEVLVVLAGSPGRLVTREQLLDTVWDSHPGADPLLTRAVSELRRALHDRRDRPAMIETVPKRGYRLLAEVEPQGSRGPPAARARPWLNRPALGAAVALMAVALGLVWLWPGSGRGVRGPDPAPAAIRPDGEGPSIAVLPFVDMSDQTRDDNLAGGLSEEIRNLLGQIPELRVIGRNSAASVGPLGNDPRGIGRSLGVRTILQGTVRRSGDRIRITAYLVDASSGADLWSGSYDRTLSEVFSFQDDVASAIIDALKIHVTKRPTRGRPTDVPEAYALFLRARRALQMNDVQAAKAALEEAVTLDPEFAEAYQLLAHVYWTDDMPDIRGAEASELVRQNALQALAIDPSLAYARALSFEGSANEPVTDVMDAYLAAAERHPNDPIILRALSWELMLAGYLSEAMSVTQRYVELDPLSSRAHMRRAAVLAALGRDEESMASLKIGEGLDPGGLNWNIGEAYLIRGRDETAKAYFDAHVGEDGGEWTDGLVAAARRSREALDVRIAAVLAATEESKVADMRFTMNCLYLLAGYLDRYFAIILDRDTEAQDVEYYVWWGTAYRKWGFTADPRYLEVARRMGFVDAWEQRGPPDYCQRMSGEWECR